MLILFILFESCWLKLFYACFNLMLFTFAFPITTKQGSHLNFFSICTLWFASPPFLCRFFQFCFSLCLGICKFNGCSPITDKEISTQPRLFQWFQMGLVIRFLQLTFVRSIIQYTVENRYIIWYSFDLNNYLLSSAVSRFFLSQTK